MGSVVMRELETFSDFECLLRFHCCVCGWFNLLIFGSWLTGLVSRFSGILIL